MKSIFLCVIFFIVISSCAFMDSKSNKRFPASENSCIDNLRKNYNLDEEFSGQELLTVIENKFQVEDRNFVPSTSHTVTSLTTIKFENQDEILSIYKTSKRITQVVWGLKFKCDFLPWQGPECYCF